MKTSKKKKDLKGRKVSKSKKQWAWQLFPLYGLVFSDDDGLYLPLWSDATLIGRQKVMELIGHQSGKQASHFLSHGRLSEALGKEAMENVGNGASLVEIIPDSYIAVRSRSTPELSARRAEEVRTMLSATMFLRGARNTAFCGDPSEYAWHITPRYITIAQGAPPQSTFEPRVNPNIVQRPLTVHKAALRNSIATGEDITSAVPGWDIASTHPACQLLNKAHPNGFELRLMTVARQLQRAACSPSNRTKLQLAVTAWETLLAHASFSDLENRVTAFFPQDTRIASILGIRHKLTHEPDPPHEVEVEQVSSDAISIGWLLFDVGVAFSTHLNAQEFDEYTELLCKVSSLDQQVKKLTRTEADAGLLKCFHEHFKGKHGKFTNRAFERLNRQTLG